MLCMDPITTTFVRRLRDRDEAAWFELWETFGPVIRAQLAKWGRGRIQAETIRDLTQETLAELSDSIERFDPDRGVRFSTWLLAIAKHVLGDEIDRRMAGKRGGGRRAASLDESFMGESRDPDRDAEYERDVFRAKVLAAIRATEQETNFLHFQVYRMRVLDGIHGKEVARQLGISEPTVSRHLARVREALRRRLRESIATFSFTPEELDEAAVAGLDADDLLFDEAIGEIQREQADRAARRAGGAGREPAR
jgi:RNA polymerase sigma factor (sigma-70 family)